MDLCKDSRLRKQQEPHFLNEQVREVAVYVMGRARQECSAAEQKFRVKTREEVKDIDSQSGEFQKFQADVARLQTDVTVAGVANQNRAC
eukprot:3130332-Amphidinium_carterae.2